MLLACWSPKGGSGTTVVAASLALTLSRASVDVVLADVAGDAAAVLGVPDDGPGLTGWLAAADDVGTEALRRLEVEVAPRLALLPGGAHDAGPPGPARAAVLAGGLAADERVVVVDCGTLRPTGADVGRAVLGEADVAVLVVRPCYLALRRAASAGLATTAAVVVVEPERSLRGRDVEAVLGVPVAAELPLRADVARRVDAGLLSSSLPPAYTRRLLGAARRLGIAA